MPIHDAGGIEQHLVSDACHPVGSLRVVVSVCHDELLALFEIKESLAKFLEGSIVSLHHTGFKIYSLDFVVFFGNFDGSEEVVKSLGGQEFVAHQFGKRVFGGAFAEFACQFDAKNAAFLNGRGGL